MLVATLGVVGAIVAGGDVQHAAAPRIRIVHTAPLVLRASGFGSRERVTLSVTVGRSAARRVVRADLGGGFLARYPALVYDRCHGALKVVATGARGHRAGFVLEPLPCPNAQTN